MEGIRNKQRPFRLLKYLYENTDEEHPVTTSELVEIFKAEDAHAKKEAAPAKAETRSAARTAEAPEAKQNIEPAADGAPAQHKSKVLSNEKE